MMFCISLCQTSPLPSPLLPLITRLNNQLQILTQPRHIDSISRRLKLLISDLDRASAAQNQSNRRPNSNSAQQPQSQPQAPASSPLQEQLLPLLKRIEPSLPHIPHILTRLRTLSALHTSAGEFQSTLEGLEEEQRRTHQALDELQGAVDTVEKSLADNRDVIGKNMQGLERRIEALLDGVEKLSR
jgi:nuclear migration protein JNM1